MKTGIVTWGLKSFYAHTPTWAKHLMVAVFGMFGCLIFFDQTNPGIIPPGIDHYILLATPIVLVGLHAFGIKSPLDADGKPINQPSDQIVSLTDATDKK